MAILTKLDKKDFEEILSNYNVGKYKSHKHVDHALQNTVFILDTTKGRYVLKIFEKSEVNFVKFQIKIIEYLYKNKIPVARISKLKNNRNLLFYKNKIIAIQKFLEGKPAKKLNDDLAKNIAKNLALMNKTLFKLKLKGEFEWVKNHEFMHNPDVKNIEGVNFVKYEKNLLKEIKKLNKKKLRRSAIHGDFHDDNILVEKNKVKAIIDWDDAHEDYVSYEIAVYLISYFSSDKINESKKYIQLFFKEYQKYLKLNEEEAKATYYFMKQRFLGVIFWHKKQKRIHKNFEKKLDKTMKIFIKRYLDFEGISLDEFLGLAKN
jgi:homoserine kinase type II